MVNEIFFSYSWKDRPMAMRIYADLVRSGFKVWRDLYSVRHDKTFQDEIGKAAHLCSAVVLLDSENSRYSAFVHDEWKVVTQSLDWKEGRKKIVICLIGDVAATRKAPQLFPRHNRYHYIDFSTIGPIYDNERRYLDGINALCHILGKPFISAYPDITEKDFEDELSRQKLTDTDRDILLKEFELIQLRIRQGFPHIIRRLELFNNECESIKIICPSPMLQLGIEYAKSKDYQQARNLLNIYTKIFPDDSRGWRTLASVLYDTQEYEQALAAYNKAIWLCLHIKFKRKPMGNDIRFDSQPLAAYLPLLKMNRASTLFELGYYTQALHAYERAIAEKEKANEALPIDYLYIICACEMLNHRDEMGTWIEKALEHHYNDEDILWAKARWLINQRDFTNAFLIYDALIERDTQNAMIYAAYLILLKRLECKKFDTVYAKAMKQNPLITNSIKNLLWQHLKL